MQVSLEGMKFVACREGLVTRAYYDGKYKDGTPKYSIGFGSQTPPPKEGDTISIESAFNRLKEDIQAREKDLNTALKKEISQSQFDALFSLYYQSGSRALRTVAAVFNTGARILAMAAFLEFNRDQGVPSDGLTKRRIREMILGVDDYYGDLSKIAFYDGNPREVIKQYMPFPDTLTTIL